MNRILTVTFVASILLLSGCSPSPQAEKMKQTYSSFDLPSEHVAKEIAATATLNLEGVPVADVLKTYEGLSGRAVVHGQLPQALISVHSATPLNRIQALQILDTVLAQNGITMVLSGDNAVKAVPDSTATSESPPNIPLPWHLLPDSSSFMSRTVQLTNLQGIYVVPMLAPLSKMPNSVLVIQSPNHLILRDYSSNIKQQLKLLEELEQKQLEQKRSIK